MIEISGKNLTIEKVVRVARHKEKIKIGDSAIKKIKKSRQMVEDLVKNEEIVYGITTGFGRFSDQKISNTETLKLQENLIKSHAAGCGEPLAEEVVRAMMLLRINNLALGHSGIRYKTLRLLVDLLNNDIVPWIPEQGSVGASGDLIPLAHMVLVMMGEGRAYYRDKLMKGSQALDECGLKAVKLKEKEGLALINGTQMMTALACLAVYDTKNLVQHADFALSLSMEGLTGILAAFDPDIQNLRNHKGQKEVASNVRYLTEDSKLTVYKNPERVQDSYTLRCAPQVHGASRSALAHVEKIISKEINAVTDNPLLFPEKDKVISGGNFHGQPLALAVDYLAMAVSELGNISERRIARMVDGSLNNDLEMFLTKKGGLNSGYMIVQYTAASLVAENKVLAGPSSTDSIPTSANQEDHVSMGAVGARKLRKIVNNLRQILAIEFIVAVQAIDLRTENPEKMLGKGSKLLYEKIRSHVPPLEDDRELYQELNDVKKLIEKRILKKQIKGNIKIF
ncbi:MAG: histidine ammonia-lyase [Bacillota bacterium]